VMVGAALGLGLAGAAAAAPASAAAPSGHTWYVKAGGGTADQAFQGLGFYPGIITVDVGDTVVWTDGSKEPHTVSFLSGKSVPPSEEFAPIGGSTYDGTGIDSSGMLMPGHSYQLTFTKPGVYMYQCLMHPGMVGVVIVQPAGTPYPETQAQYDQEGRAALAADLAVLEKAWSTVRPVVTAGPGGSEVYHAFAGFAPPPVATVPLQALGGSGVHGVASLRIVPPGALEVTVSVSGLAPGSEHLEHIHLGTCSRQGPVLYGLEPLKADAHGQATATTVIKGVLGIAEAGWYVNVHAANASLTPIACGDVVYHNASVMRFNPSTLTIHAGDTVVWVQPAANEAHTVTILAPGQNPAELTNPAVQNRPAGGHVVTGPAFYNSGLLLPGQTYSLTFSKPGTYSYRCLLHDDMGMLARVVVLPKA